MTRKANFYIPYNRNIEGNFSQLKTKQNRRNLKLSQWIPTFKFSSYRFVLLSCITLHDFLTLVLGNKYIQQKGSNFIKYNNAFIKSK